VRRKIFGQWFAGLLPAFADRRPSPFGLGLRDLLGFAVSNSSSWSSRGSIWRMIRSDERPNCISRSLPTWNSRFSIPSARNCTDSSAAFSST
jgi:hypothetical protein